MQIEWRTSATKSKLLWRSVHLRGTRTSSKNLRETMQPRNIKRQAMSKSRKKINSLSPHRTRECAVRSRRSQLSTHMERWTCPQMWWATWWETDGCSKLLSPVVKRKTRWTVISQICPKDSKNKSKLWLAWCAEMWASRSNQSMRAWIIKLTSSRAGVPDALPQSTAWTSRHSACFRPCNVSHRAVARACTSASLWISLSTHLVRARIA